MAPLPGSVCRRYTGTSPAALLRHRLDSRLTNRNHSPPRRLGATCRHTLGTAARGCGTSGANWSDDGTTGVAPGASDDAFIGSNPGVDVLSGPAEAAELTVAQFEPFTVAFTGTAEIGTIPYADGGTRYLVQAGGTLAVGSISTAWIIQANGAGALVSASDTIDGFATALDGGSVRIGSPPSGAPAVSGALYADRLSSIEVGGGTTAPAGDIVVDAGFTMDATYLAFSTDAVVGGVVRSTGPVAFAAALSGTGTVEIASSLVLALPAGAGVTLAFTGAQQALSLEATDASGSGATVTGFAAGDTIDSTVAFDAFSLTADTGGESLALIAQGTTIQTLQLAGAYAAADLVVVPILYGPGDGVPQTGQLSSGAALVFAANAATAPAPAPGPSGSNAEYDWDVSAGGGDWDVASNWKASAPPGANNVVSITNYGGTLLPIVNGDGAASTLELAGPIVLNGAFTANTIEFAGKTDLLSGSSLSATTMSGGELLVGAADVVSVTGSYVIGDALDVYDGGSVSVGTLVSSTSALVTVDQTSRIRVGSAGGAAAGALTVDANASADLGGITLDAALVNDGAITTDEGTIDGNITGSGTILFSGSLTLDGSVAASQTLAFDGFTLDRSAAGIVAGRITGIAAGDAIVVSPDVTAAAFARTSGSRGTLTLSDAAGQVVRTLDVSTVAGSLGDVSYLVVPELTNIDDVTQTAVVAFAGTTEAGPPPAPAPGTAAGQSFQWAALGGAWGTAANWGTTEAPGSLDSVTLNPPGQIDVVLTGAGDAASVTENGIDALSGRFLFGTLTIEQSFSYGTSGFGDVGIDVTAGSTLTSGTVDLAAGSLTAVGAGASIDIVEALSVGQIVFGDFAAPPALLAALGGAQIDVAAGIVTADIANSNEVIDVDASSVIEIGTTGGAASGALTVDAGHTLDATTTTIIGTIVNDGVVAADVIDGSVSGDGTLDAPTRVTGTVAASQHILFTDGDTIEFGNVVAATLSGFDASDEIIVDTLVTAATYAARVPAWAR